MGAFQACTGQGGDSGAWRRFACPCAAPPHRAGPQIMTVPGGRDPTFPTHRHPPPLPFRDHKPLVPSAPSHWVRCGRQARRPQDLPSWQLKVQGGAGSYWLWESLGGQGQNPDPVRWLPGGGRDPEPISWPPASSCLGLTWTWASMAAGIQGTPSKPMLSYRTRTGDRGHRHQRSLGTLLRVRARQGR